MARFDRYIVNQLLVLFAFFSLILVSIYWINRAVILFDQLIANGHSAMVFLEFTSLSLPNLIRIVLPVAGVVAVIWGVNRLSGDSELVIARATGFSPWRLARPALYFGLVLTILLSGLSHWLVPVAEAELSRREAEISRDLTARFLREGEFLHPARDMTFFVTEIEPETGLMKDIMLTDRSSEEREITYTARRAILMRTDGNAQIIMLDGMAQAFNYQTNALSLTTFEDLVYDISDSLTRRRAPRTRPTELTTPELLWDEELQRQIKWESEEAAMIINARISEALLAPVAILVAFASLSIGNFSRFGLWRQIALGVGLIILLKSFDNSVIAAARKSPETWPQLYAPTLLGLALAAVLLWIASNPGRLRRRRRKGAE